MRFVARNVVEYADAMLQACANPNCSVHYAVDRDVCPICGTPAKPIEQHTASTPTTPTGRDAKVSGGKMTEEERRGKDLLTALLLLMLLFDVVASLLAVTVLGASVLPRLLRFGFTLLLCTEMYRGSIAARRLTVALCVLACLWLIVTIVEAKELIVTAIGCAVMVLVVAFAANLVNSRRINAFMAYQRRNELEAIRKSTGPEIVSQETKLSQVPLPSQVDQDRLEVPKSSAVD